MPNAVAFPSGIPAWKRPLDLFVLLLLSPALLPLMCAIACGIKLVSPGPVFFRQARVGHRGRPFTCYKFRSMKANADTEVHREYLQDLIHSAKPMTKLDTYDPRLIPLGPLLRASGLDELGQLINVLRGEMSFVGPRPCTPYEYQDYSDWHKQRLETLPGITGLWQVSGKNKTTFSEMVRLDVAYISKQSLRLDLAIMAKTFPTLASQVREALRHKNGKTQAMPQSPRAFYGGIVSKPVREEENR